MLSETPLWRIEEVALVLEYGDRVLLGSEERADALLFASETARAAGEAILPYFRAPVDSCKRGR